MLKREDLPSRTLIYSNYPVLEFDSHQGFLTCTCQLSLQNAVIHLICRSFAYTISSQPSKPPPSFPSLEHAMRLHALAAFLAISSVSGLFVPNVQGGPITDIQEARTTPWAGVESTTGVLYTGATSSERAVPGPSQPLIDVTPPQPCPLLPSDFPLDSLRKKN